MNEDETATAVWITAEHDLQRLEILSGRPPSGPWGDLPLLVETGILTTDEAKGLVLAHEQILQRCFVDLEELLTGAFEKDQIDPDTFMQARRLVAKAMRRGTPQTGA